MVFASGFAISLFGGRNVIAFAKPLKEVAGE
jgi:hypothetical protein